MYESLTRLRDLFAAMTGRPAPQVTTPDMFASSMGSLARALADMAGKPREAQVAAVAELFEELRPTLVKLASLHGGLDAMLQGLRMALAKEGVDNAPTLELLSDAMARAATCARRDNAGHA